MQQYDHDGEVVLCSQVNEIKAGFTFRDAFQSQHVTWQYDQFISSDRSSYSDEGLLYVVYTYNV